MGLFWVVNVVLTFLAGYCVIRLAVRHALRDERKARAAEEQVFKPSVDR